VPTERAGVTSGGPSDAQTHVPGESAIPDPNSAQKPEQKQQGADRPEEEPTSPGANTVKETKEEAEQAAQQDFKKDPNDHSGEPLGTVKHDGSDTTDDGQPPAHESEKKGTGREYVKSSGLKADGGDFDASKPGAEREADREFYT